LPTREQVERAESAGRAARERLAGRPQLIYVSPDYYGPYPKPCVGGWGRRQLTVTPNGDVLPCPAAGQMTELPIENVQRRPLAWIYGINDSGQIVGETRFLAHGDLLLPGRGQIE
jgi:pyrroloquinoline quinone biosynthesis protein E